MAWNAAGHRIAAAITYDHLTPRAKARVDEILRHHPDYNLFVRDVPPDPEARGRAAFLAAAVWPDTIRNDKRFWDETKAGAEPTPQLPGFPDMQRHTRWHYIGVPITPDGVAAHVQAPPHALSEYERLIRNLTQPVGSEANPAYALPWVLHIEEDLHEPLHTVDRYLRSQPAGDASGNAVYFRADGGRANGQGYATLHGIWDGGVGTDSRDSKVREMAQKIVSEYSAAHGNSPKMQKDPRRWIAEGSRVARKYVYTFGLETGTKEQPLPEPEGYRESVGRVSRTLVAEAGLRMALILNDLLR